MAVRLNCSPCGAEIHQPNAELLGPPDVSQRSRRHAICRLCFNRLMAYWPVLRDKAQAQRLELAAAVAAGPGTPARPSETRPGRRGIRAP